MTHLQSSLLVDSFKKRPEPTLGVQPGVACPYLPWVLATISGSIPPAFHPKGPSLWLQPLMSRPLQLDPRLRPLSSVLRPPQPPALWNEFTKVPLCLPGTLPFCKSWARMGVWRRAGPAVITAGPFEVSSRNTRASSRWAQHTELKCRHPPLL